MNPAPEVWKKVLALMEGTEEDKLAKTTINTWFSDTEALSLETDRLVLYTPSEFNRGFIVDRYIPHIQRAMRELFSSDFEITVLTGEEKESLGREEPSFLPGTEEYTFDKFVVGESNQFAYSAAKAVAEALEPPIGYNPLFFYGESGLGKTHLLYAIAHAFHAKFPDRRVIYIKGETFTNELIAAIQQGKNQEFRQKYRFCDMFLMDDVQFLAGKRYSQEEMFHTFNTLYELKKQIVFTSDRPPKEMLRLEDRLKTRFEWGLLADIVPPDYETRTAIIKNKAIQLGTPLPDNICSYIAENVTDSIRELVGVVASLVAQATVLNCDINLELARPVVAHAIRMRRSQVNFAMITQAVAAYFKINPDLFFTSTRKREISDARQIVMYLAKKLAGMSLKNIGTKLGRTHATVIYACRSIDDRLSIDAELRNQIEEIRATLNS